jgi:hypothetical protein
MSFYGAAALKPQRPTQSISSMGYYVAPAPLNELTPNNLDEERKWSEYFSRIIDQCSTNEQIDAVYDHWSNCINADKFKAIPTSFKKIDHCVPPPIYVLRNPIKIT